MLDVIVDTLLDSARVLPFLFLTYLLMELLEHKGGDLGGKLRGAGRVGPLVGAALGLLPQCGFSAAASSLYVGRIITTGTLLSVYLATSDEMLPILLSSGAPLPTVLGLLGAKFGIGMLAGFLVDLVSRLLGRREEEACIEDFCEREHCSCEDHVVLSALKHTVRVTVFILLFNFALNTVIYLIGRESLSAIATAVPVLGNVVCTLLGLIPNCASSVVLTELYLEGVITVGSLMSGLLVGSGIGIAILFKNNRPMKDTFRVLGLLCGIGLLCGLGIDLIM